MKRKNHATKRRVIVLFFPLTLLTLFTIAFGAWRDYVSFNMNFTAPQEPTIQVDSYFLNVQNNVVSLIVDYANSTIENTNPNTLQILINVTSSGTTPITKLVINDTLPREWNPVQQPIIKYTRTDGTTTLIDPKYFTVVYDSISKTLCISLPDIKAATGRFLTQDETIFIVLSLKYALIGNELPPEHRYTMIFYTNRITATAYITSWQSQPITSSLSFATIVMWT